MNAWCLIRLSRDRISWLLIFFAATGFSQEIQILSASDSLRIPFASVLITGEELHCSATATEKGIVHFKQNFNDTVPYDLSVYCFGYDKFRGQYTGFQLKQLGLVLLSPSKIGLEEVVITAQYEATSTDKAVQKIKVIDSEKIRQMGAVNLRDVLTNQLNLRLVQDNILGSGLSVQGISGENVKILIDGVPMIGRLNGNIDLSQINLAAIERIELVEGPLSVQYGTNALAGTINLISKKNNTKALTGSLSPYYESIGTYNLTTEIGLGLKKHRFRFSAGRNYFDGWNNEQPFYFPTVKQADSSRYLSWKPKEQYVGTLSYQYPIKKAELGFSSGYFRERIVNRGYPRAPYGESAFDDYYTTQRVDNSLVLKSKWSAKYSLNALAAYNTYKRIKTTVYKDLTNLQETLSETSADQDTSRFSQLMSRVSFIRQIPDARFNYELGYDLNYESAYGQRIDRELQTMGDYALFATSEYKVNKRLLLKPGLRVSYNTAYASPLVPSLHLKWAIHERHQLRASYARGFRAPTIKELYFLFVDINHNIVGNKSLQAEQSDNYLLNYGYNRDVRRCRLKLDATVFYNSIYHLITLAQSTTVLNEYSYVNIGRYKTLGWQVNSSLAFRRWQIQLGYNYTGRSTNLAGNSGAPDFTYSPEGQMNVSYQLSRRYKTQVSAFYKYTGRLPGYSEVDGKVQQTSVSDYQMLDITLSHSFFKDRLQLNTGCKNVLDVTSVFSSISNAGAHATSSSSLSVSTGRNYFIKLLFKIG